MTIQSKSPMSEISYLIEEAKKTPGCVANIFSLATVDSEGQPSVRHMFLDAVEDDCFIFFTAANSRKAKHLKSNSRAGMCIYLDKLHRQIQIEGTTEILDVESAKKYWSGRNRYAQFSAWSVMNDNDVSNIGDDEIIRKRYAFEKVPLAPGWCGYRLVPHRIDIWKTGWSHPSEHDCFKFISGQWQVVDHNA